MVSKSCSTHSSAFDPRWLTASPFLSLHISQQEVIIFLSLTLCWEAHRDWGINKWVLVESRHWTHGCSLASSVPGGSPDGGAGAQWDPPTSPCTLIQSPSPVASPPQGLCGDCGAYHGWSLLLLRSALFFIASFTSHLPGKGPLTLSHHEAKHVFLIALPRLPLPAHWVGVCVALLMCDLQKAEATCVLFPRLSPSARGMPCPLRHLIRTQLRCVGTWLAGWTVRKGCLRQASELCELKPDGFQGTDSCLLGNLGEATQA